MLSNSPQDGLSPMKGDANSPMKRHVSTGDQPLNADQSSNSQSAGSGLDRFAKDANANGNSNTDGNASKADSSAVAGLIQKPLVDFELRSDNYRSADFDPLGILTEEKSIAGDLRTFINFIFVRNIHRMIALPWPDLLQGKLLVKKEGSTVRKTAAGVWEYKCDFGGEGSIQIYGTK
jgi:hypothetical protein